MGACPRCGRKQLMGSGLCPQCREAMAGEQGRRNTETVKKALPGMFDRLIWDAVNARFGMSRPSDKDWSMVRDLIRPDRERFLSLVEGIATEKYVNGLIYNPRTKRNENLFAGWEGTLVYGEGSSAPGFYDPRARDLNECFRQAMRRIHLYCDAEIAIRAGRYEDAARSYENLTMYEEAGRIRKMALNERNTSRNVSVNMNQLIDQVRQGGLALAYKCPNCGGSINIDKDFNPGMRVCAYCGTPLDTTVIASMIRSL
ncbi:MAG: hypothetical protein A4E30_00156 [Methanomassiliicoccales archaeon PtaB.Bin215]|nr:MAG: hypothetical protein A4E30_00156 [Methanomassiliicoccales archaeon PtaB.Bin215]